MNIKILVAAHKKYQMPTDRDLYLPIFVGKELHPNSDIHFAGDNTGDNISNKNATYNELTAIYWAWKNLEADAVGLDHYRRYMSETREKNIESVLTKAQVEKLFESTDIILPEKRKYYIQNNYQHYVHAHHAKPLDETRMVLKDLYPDYLESYDDLMGHTSAHMFNMFIMKRNKFDDYCEWMFAILEELETRIDISEFDTYERRVLGFISELLLDVWINKNQFSYTEVKLVHMESQHWFKKGSKFLMRMFVKPRK